jgi:TatD DNase family protein
MSEELKWIDTHSHYDTNKLKNNKALLESLPDYCKYIITLGTNMQSNTNTLVMISLYEYMWGMIGFFPTDVYQLEEKYTPHDVDMYTFNAKDNLNVYLHQLLNQKIVGIGEIGLDYHWDCIGDSRKKVYCKGEEARELQQKWFRYQLDLAKEKDLPVSMHSRDAEDDTIKIFKDYDTIKGVMHCFSYGMKSAEYYLNKGLYLGIGGTSTYKGNKELKEVIKECPIDRILLETDAPYLSPEPVRRSVNNSTYITYVIDNIASIKGISREEVITQTNKNAIDLFKFSKK